MAFIVSNSHCAMRFEFSFVKNISWSKESFLSSCFFKISVISGSLQVFSSTPIFPSFQFKKGNCTSAVLIGRLQSTGDLELKLEGTSYKDIKRVLNIKSQLASCTLPLLTNAGNCKWGWQFILMFKFPQWSNVSIALLIKWSDFFVDQMFGLLCWTNSSNYHRLSLSPITPIYRAPVKVFCLHMESFQSAQNMELKPLAPE